MAEWSGAEIRAARDELRAGAPTSALARLLLDEDAASAPDAPPDSPPDAPKLSDGALEALSHLDRLFLARAPDAPGLWLAGGGLQVEGGARAFAGTGESAPQAAARLAGETAEFLARRDPPPPADLAPELPEDIARAAAADPALTELEARYGAAPAARARLLTAPGAPEVLAPACWFHARQAPAAETGAALGAGLAAAPEAADARLASALELIERDATALWWLGGAKARRMAPEGAGAARLGALADRLRRGRMGRRHWFLELPCDLGLSVVAALSLDDKGEAGAWGFAARLDPIEAAAAAFREMCQIECGWRLVELKRAQAGEAALSGHDRAHLMTADRLIQGGEAVFPAETVARGADAEPVSSLGAEARIAALAARLDEAGFAWLCLPLRDAGAGLAVAKSAIPGLQGMDPRLKTARLDATISAWGGPSAALEGCSLI